MTDRMAIRREGSANAISRRDMLRLVGGAAGLAAVAACTPTVSTPGPLPSASPSAPKVPQSWTAALPAEAASLDPVQDFATSGLLIQAHVFDPLVDFEGPELKGVGYLATEWKTVSPTIWEFKLRQGVKFHNGKTFSAEDVAYTFEVAQDPQRSRLRVYFGSVDRLEVVDPYTVRIHTKQPFAPLLAQFANIRILPKGAWDAGADAFGRQPIGTGLYRVVQWTRNQQVQLEAFDNAWRASAWRVPAKLTVRTIPEAATRVAELKTGGVNLVTGVPFDDAVNLATDSTVDVVADPAVRSIYYWLQTLRPPLNDPRVRQALHYALDGDAIVKNILQGHAKRRVSMFMPGGIGFDPTLSPYPYDPAKARSLLSQAGVGTGLTLQWNTWKGVTPKDVEIVQYAANQLKDVGITVTTQVLDQSTHSSRRIAGDFQIAAAMSGNQPEPDTVIASMLVPSAVSKYYNNPDADKLIAEGRAEVDPTKRSQIYVQLARLLYQDCPHLTMYAFDEMYGVTKGSGWRPYAHGANAGLPYLIPFAVA